VPGDGGEQRRHEPQADSRRDDQEADGDDDDPQDAETGPSLGTIRVTTVRMTRPITSSATAAPRTVLASTEASARRSPKTLAVIPTLVAVRAAPMNRASLPSRPKA
jgi:hypothetical protein